MLDWKYVRGATWVFKRLCDPSFLVCMSRDNVLDYGHVLPKVASFGLKLEPWLGKLVNFNGLIIIVYNVFY